MAKEDYPKYTFPHCDSRVVHAPEDNCEFCNDSGLQKIREAWGMSYTGHPDPTKTVCPAEKARGMKSINSWHGNIAHTPEVKEVQKAYYAQLAADLKADIEKFQERIREKDVEVPQEVKSQIEELGKRLVDLD